MKYDFTTILDRAGHDALAIDGVRDGDGFRPGVPKEGFSAIPMWVADMNFPVAPPIIEAIQRRAAHPSFGYFEPSDEYYASIIRWQAQRNGVDIPRGAIGYENGVLGCLASSLRAFTLPGESVFMHSPTYVGFLGTIGALGRNIVRSPLCRDDDGVWRIDFADTERVISENNVHFAIFCSPYNPVGRVWERDEIERFMDICRRYDVTVFSDEIWSDIILDGRFIPTHSISDDARMRTITAYAPSKTFNLAGLIGSYHVIFNKRLRDRHDEAAQQTHYNSMNVLSQHALIGAYSGEGMVWADELCETIRGNARYACEHITRHYAGVSLAMPQGTYMLFLELSDYCREHGRSLDEILRAGWDVGVLWQDGRPFGGECTIRMNLALPLSRVKEAFERLDKYVFGVKSI